MKMEPTAPLFRPVGGAHEALKSLVLGFKYTGTTYIPYIQNEWSNEYEKCILFHLI